MFNTELGIFCSLNNNWEELLTQEPYNLKISEDGPYVMFKYNQLSSDFNNPIVREARGIIFRKGEWENPVCWGFNKFGNYGESYAPEIDWSTAFVTEKIDGSLIKVWWDGSWKVSTNGTIDAEKAELSDVKVNNFRQYFELVLERYINTHIFRTAFQDFTADLDRQLTYMFELVGPYNRVVIPYDEPDLYFLGARNNFTGEEYTCTALEMESLGVGLFRRPAVYSLTSLNDCLKAAELKSWDEEGFVVCDAKFNRVKIKSPAYVLAHFMRNNNVITKKHLINVILLNEVEEFLCYASDYKEELLETRKLMRAFINMGNSMAATCREARSLQRSKYAELVKTFPKIYHALLYRNYDRHCTVEEFTSGWHLNKWEEHLDTFEKMINNLFEA